MGKPFSKEIRESQSTIKWALEQDVSEIQERLFRDMSKPLYIVGSGGSLSACHFVATLYQRSGFIAKAITPLDLYYSRFALRNSKVLFISSSGRNTDILFAFNMAVQNFASEILSVCMRLNAPLTGLANTYSVSKGIEYDIPTKKDGFLATNSLTAFFTLFAKASGLFNQFDAISDLEEFREEVSDFVSKISFSATTTVIYGGWSSAIAYDIESKFTEAALGSVLLTDYRNFGHGRHHWFAKRKSESAIIALITPEEEKIANKTLNLIPDYIPKLKIETPRFGPAAAIELLLKVYEVVDAVGKASNIDPGRPGVPEFGSKLYHLKYSSFYKTYNSVKISRLEEAAILKKANKSSLNFLSGKEMDFWRDKFSLFHKKMNTAKFGSIVFDYDGTLCGSESRYNDSLPENLSNEITNLLKAGIVVGIATGRGQSVRTVMQNSIKSKPLWKNIIIGYYNGADISTLNDSEAPDTTLPHNSFLSNVEKQLKDLSKSYDDVEIKLRPSQLTIQSKHIDNWIIIRKLVQNIVMTDAYKDLQILESSHSIDVVVKSKASKLNVVKACVELALKNNKHGECLTIGDKGQWPGNDYELLSTEYSLSVDEVSSHPNTCWNFSDIGMKGQAATISILQKIQLNKNHFRIQL